jgi:hypothetical protein
MLSETLAGAVISGVAVNRAGYSRNWQSVRATGNVRDGRHGQVIEIDTPKGLRSITLSRFTGVISGKGQTVFYSAGRVVKNDTRKVRQALADVVLGKGQNKKVARARY